jgi:hypothetical protein
LLKEAVTKLETHYLNRRDRMQRKRLQRGRTAQHKVKVLWKKHWEYSTHAIVAALALYLKLWELLDPRF